MIDHDEDCDCEACEIARWSALSLFVTGLMLTDLVRRL